MKRTSVKRGIWTLCGRKKQKGGFLPILETIAKPFLVSAAGGIGSKPCWEKKVAGKKIFGGKRKRVRRVKRKRKRLRYA